MSVQPTMHGPEAKIVYTPMPDNSSAEFSAQLIPFDQNQLLPIKIQCTGFVKNLQSIEICYTVTGDLKNIVFDKPVRYGERTDNLWQKSCFEIFLTNNTSSNYWEYNLSPSSNWAVYGFTAYREGKFDDLSVNTIPISSQMQASQFKLQSTIPLPKPLIGQKLKIGLSSVVQDENGVIYYYALQHLRDQPDFHDLDSFLIGVQT